MFQRPSVIIWIETLSCFCGIWKKANLEERRVRQCFLGGALLGESPMHRKALLALTGNDLPICEWWAAYTLDRAACTPIASCYTAYYGAKRRV
jgi:hypothetical protein